MPLSHLKRTPVQRRLVLGQTLEFMQRLWALDHALQSVSKRMESTLGVTGPQRLVVRMLGQFPGLTSSEVAAVLHLHKSTLTGIIQRLEAGRIIIRKVDRQDLRRARLFLTRRGEAINRIHTGTVEMVARQLLQRSSPVEVRVFSAVLGKLIDALGGIRSKSRAPGSRTPSPIR